MSETKADYQSGGLISTAQTGAKSQSSLTHGNEPRAMLLALLNSALMSLAERQWAKVVGSGHFGGRTVSIIFVFDVLPTAEGLKMEVAE